MPHRVNVNKTDSEKNAKITESVEDLKLKEVMSRKKNNDDEKRGKLMQKLTGESMLQVWMVDKKLLRGGSSLI